MSWCEPCIEEIPILETLQSEVREQGLMIVGIDAEPPERAKEFLAKTATVFDPLSMPIKRSRSDIRSTGFGPVSSLVGTDASWHTS